MGKKKRGNFYKFLQIFRKNAGDFGGKEVVWGDFWVFFMNFLGGFSCSINQIRRLILSITLLKRQHHPDSASVRGKLRGAYK